jgi:hypothetical protein
MKRREVIVYWRGYFDGRGDDYPEASLSQPRGLNGRFTDAKPSGSKVVAEPLPWEPLLWEEFL